MSAHKVVHEYLKTVEDDLHFDARSLFVEFRATDFLVNEDEPGLKLSSDELEQLVRASESDSVSFDVAMQLAEWLSGLKEPLPQELREFAVEAMCGKRRRPSKPGQSPYKFLVRNAVVQVALKKAIEEEPHLREFRNDESVCYSACDVVSECLEKFGISLSYDGVKTVRKRYLQNRNAMVIGNMPRSD